MRIFVWHSSDVWEEVVMFDVFQVHRQKKGWRTTISSVFSCYGLEPGYRNKIPLNKAAEFGRYHLQALQLGFRMNALATNCK
jgi:hypothetical protein